MQIHMLLLSDVHMYENYLTSERSKAIAMHCARVAACYCNCVVVWPMWRNDSLAYVTKLTNIQKVKAIAMHAYRACVFMLLWLRCWWSVLCNGSSIESTEKNVVSRRQNSAARFGEGQFKWNQRFAQSVHDWPFWLIYAVDCVYNAWLYNIAGFITSVLDWSRVLCFVQG